jgi:hypothetical protein
MNAASEFGPTLEGRKHIFADGQPTFGILADKGGQFLPGRDMLSKFRKKTLATLNGLWAGETIRCTRGEDPFIMKETVYFNQDIDLTKSGNVAVDSTGILTSLKRPLEVDPSKRNAAPSAKGTASKNWKAATLQIQKCHKRRAWATCLFIWNRASKICQTFASMQAVRV